MTGTSTSARVQRRRDNQRQRIIQEAAARFADLGPDAVRLDQVADAADVSRGTLYSHFQTKEELLRAIMRPALEAAVDGLRTIGRGRARARMDGLLALYLELWRDHRNALRVSHRLRHLELAETAALHAAFAQGVFDVLAAAARARILRTRDPMVGARMIMRTAVPLLEICTTQPRGDQLFVETMRGMLVRDRRR